MQPVRVRIAVSATVIVTQLLTMFRECWYGWEEYVRYYVDLQACMKVA